MVDVDTFTLLEVSSTTQTSYIIPLALEEPITSLFDIWSYVYGRRPKASMARVLGMLKSLYPEEINLITVTTRPNEHTTKGWEASVLVIDDPIFPEDVKKLLDNPPQSKHTITLC